jgi:hypothetical protein
VVAGAGLLASLASDSNDENDIRFDNFVSDEVALDRAYLLVAGKEAPFVVTLGLFETPFTGTEVLWDRDLRFQGAALGAELPSAAALVAQRLFGGMSVGSQNGEEESQVVAVRWEGETAASFSLGAGFWHFGRTEALVEADHARTNRLAPDGRDYLSDFDVVNVTGGWERIGTRRPIRVRLDLLHNFGAEDRRNGGEIRLDWGEVQGRGSWRLRLTLQRVEQDAVPAAFGGDEWWFRTDQRGARLGLAVGLGRRAIVEVSALRQRRDGLDEWLDRGLLDFVIPL